MNFHTRFFLLLLVVSSSVGTPLEAHAQSLVQRGDEAFNAGDMAHASKLYGRALKRARRQRNRLAEAELINNMAALQLIRGKPRQLLRYRRIADKIKRRHFLSSKRARTVLALPGNLLVGGGFERGLLPPWGGGHYERKNGKFRFGIWWNSANARAYMKIDHAIKHSGKRSLRITNFSKSKAHVFTTTSQRINGLHPNTLYRISMFIKAKELKAGAVTFTIDAAWAKRLPSLPAGSYDWQPYEATINIGHNDYIDLRLLHQNTGTVWLDDLRVEPAVPRTSSPLQQAEALFDQGNYMMALALIVQIGHQDKDNMGTQMGVHRLGGRIHAILGQYDKALASFSWLISKGEKRAHLDLGNVYRQLGQYDEAIAHYVRASEAVEGDQGRFALVMERLGRAYTQKAGLEIIAPRQHRQVELARRAFARALRILRHIGDLHGEVVALRGLAALKRLSGDVNEADALVQRALKKVSRLDDRKLHADLLMDQVETRLVSGTLPKSITPLSKALSLKRAILDRMGQIRALHLFAQIAIRKRNDEDALAHFDKAVKIIDQMREGLAALPRESRRQFIEKFETIYRGYVETAYRLWKKSGKSRPQLHELSFSMGQWSAMTTTADALAQMAARFQTGNDALARLVRERQDLARRQHGLNARLILQLAQPRKRRKESTENNLRTLLKIDEQRLQQVDHRLKSSFPDYFQLANPAPLTAKTLRKMLRPDEALVFFLDTPKTWATSGHSYIWLVSNETSAFVQIRQGQKKLAEAVRELRVGLDASTAPKRGLAINPDRAKGQGLPFNLSKSHQVYELLFGQLKQETGGKKHLIIVPSGPLTALPFQVLITKRPTRYLPDYKGYARADWLIKKHALTILPSVASFRALRLSSRKGKRASQPYMGFGNPLLLGPDGNDRSAFALKSCKNPASFQMAAAGAALPIINRAPKDLSSLFVRGLGVTETLRRQYPLPETAAELCAVSRLTGTREGAVYLGRNATESKVKDLSAKGLLGDVRIVHFATHGLLAGETRLLLKTSAEPSLLLTPPQKASQKDDGLLTASEIARLKLNADWVIMSACNTAAGGKVGGEALSGLARAFFYAGARALLVSHWYVNSQATVKLITTAFAEIEKDPHIGPSQAMRLSMIAMIVGGGANAHPANWAPFVVVGEGTAP